MSYLRKCYKEMIEEIDKKSKLPKDWNKFVEKEKTKNNLIIKDKGICTCTYCNAKFKSNKKVNQNEKCPNCKNEYLIKSGKLTWYCFEPRTLTFLDRVNDKWIVRLFEFQSSYSSPIGKVSHSEAAEFGRVLVDEGISLVNNRVYTLGYGNYGVCIYAEIKKWRIYGNYYYRWLSTYGSLYSNNLKKLMTGTEYQYSQLWKLAKKEKIDIRYYLRNNYKSTEFLIKMGLYKLALYPEDFEKKGNFEKRFGVEKSYYSFMKKNNIDTEELFILKIIKRKNMELIRDILKMGNRIDIEKVSKYVKLDKLLEYKKKQKYFTLPNYLDYIGNLEKLGVPIKGKRILFPEIFIQAHNETGTKLDNITKQGKKLNEEMEKRYKELQKNCYANERFFIRPAKNLQDLRNEADQQNNCVYRNYSEEYARGDTDIYFLRQKKEPDKSLVTIEVKNKKIRQKEQKCNQKLSTEQNKILDFWEKNILAKVA